MDSSLSIRSSIFPLSPETPDTQAIWIHACGPATLQECRINAYIRQARS